LPRRRKGDPALPRRPDRGARRKVHLRRNVVPAHLRPPAVEAPHRRVLVPAKSHPAESSRPLTRPSLIHEDMKRFFDGYPGTAHPMAILSSMVVSLSSFYRDAVDGKTRDRIESTKPPL